MHIDVDKISYEYLVELRNKLDKEIAALKKEVYVLYDLDYFKDKSLEEITSLLSSYKIENANSLANDIYEYVELENDFSVISFLFKKSNDKRKEDVLKLIDDINNVVSLEKEEVDLKIISLEKDRAFLEKIFNFLYFDKYLTSESIEEIKEYILNSDLIDDIKFSLSLRIVSILIEKSKNLEKEQIDDFDEKLNVLFLQEKVTEDVENFEIESIANEDELIVDEKLNVVLNFFEKYKKLFSECSIESVDDLDNFIYDDTEIKANLDLNSINREEFMMVLSSILFTIKNSDSETKVDLYKMYLTLLENKYGWVTDANYVSVVGELGTLIEKVDNLVLNVETNLDYTNANAYEKISDYQSIILEVKKEIDMNLLVRERVNELFVIIREIENNVNLLVKKEKVSDEEEINDKRNVPIKSFILFDYYLQDDKMIPYILNDLNVSSNNKMIDVSVTGKILNSGFKDFNLLVDDLISIGKPRYIDAASSSNADDSGQIVNRVYYENNNRMETGILRIRPRRNSVLRFFEQTVTFKANTKALEQISNIIYKHLPNASIDFNKDFSVFINYASAFKMGDVDLYDEVIKRRDNKKSLLVKWFIDNFKNKTELSEYECKLFEQVLVATLDAYTELMKSDKRFEFGIIDSLGGVKVNEK